VLATLALIAAFLVGPTVPAKGTSKGLYPDLVALPPADFYFSREILADGVAHHLLRFSATAWNAGDGRLELQGAPEPGGGTAVWQHLYDAPAGGEVVARRRLAADLTDHPHHHHVHLADFFGFALRQRGPLGGSCPRPTTNGKLSSCVFDDVLVDQSGSQPGQYQGCGAETQGLSPGWGDTYDASLPDQWVDLGPDDGAPSLRDGTYTLRVTIDPLDRIDEGGREANNAATATFVVRDGRIVGRPEPARCAVVGEAVGPVGAIVELTCSHFPEGIPIGVYWDGRDPWAEPPLPPDATFIGTAATPVRVQFAVQEAPGGGHTIAAVTPGYGEHAAAAVIYGVEPSLTIVRIPFGRAAVVTVRGFGPEEAVALTWAGTTGRQSTARVMTSPRGSATTILSLPLDEGPPRLRAVGEASGAAAETEGA
jgi:hypothetical protein